MVLILFVVGCDNNSINKQGLKLHYERTFFSLHSDLDCGEEQGDFCLLQQIVKGKNVSACEQFGEGIANYECYTKMAEKLGDFKICHKQNISEPKKSIFGGMHIWVYQCYLNLIATKGDVKLCDLKYNNTEGRIVCYNELAGVLANLDICDKIKTVEDKNNCFTWVAETLRDISICDRNIKNEYTKQFCYKNVALVLNDTSICKDKVTFDDLRFYCGIE